MTWFVRVVDYHSCRMADQSRQIKLAAAKKKLKEFQQKSSPTNIGEEKGGVLGSSGTKKKRKGKEPKYDEPSSDRNSPDNTVADMENIGSSGPLLTSELDRHSLLSNSTSTNTTINLQNPNHQTDLLQEYPDSNGNESLMEENRQLSSTESLRQLSQQLNGLVSESSVVHVNGDSASPVGERELDSRNQELSAALESSNLTNSQLNTKLDQLAQQSQELNDQLQKERKEFDQKFSKEQGAMREQLQVHIQTIGILVSEKSELQTALQYTQQAARQKAGEAEELNSRLQATKQRVSELERTLSSVSTQQKQFEKHNKELEKERDAMRLEVFRQNNLNDESKQQSSELSEQLQQRAQETASLRLEVEDLRKRLEIADLMLQQFSTQSDPNSSSQQIQSLLEEKQQMEVHNHQLMESVAQLKTERDCYAEQIQEGGRVWKDKTEQLLTQVSLVAEERDRNIEKVQQLEDTISELRNAAALQSKERENQSAAETQSPGPSQNESALQEALQTLQQEKESLEAQYQSQLCDNEQLSRLCSEQESRLLDLEQQAHRQAEDTEDRRRMLEDVQSDKATISRALTQNRTLKDQLAELQNGFVQLTNENMELTNAIQSEQHVKKELARRMGELQEQLHNGKEQLEEKSKEAQALTEQRDQVAAHLQQYSAAYQALASEREQLHQQYYTQSQIMDRLQHDESQGRAQLEVSQNELKQAQEHLNHLVKDNEQLKADVKELLESSDLAMSTRAEGDGVEIQSQQDTTESSSIVIPQDFESQKEMEEFIRATLARLEAERDEAWRQLKEERRLHVAAKHQAAVALSLSHNEHQHDHNHDHHYDHHHDHHHDHNHDHHHEHEDTQAQHSHCEHHHQHSEGGTVPPEVHQALQTAMEKLQHRFTSLMQEKVDLKERVEELEHRCIQLSGETDTIGEYIALYQSQRAIMKQKHQEKEHYISMLAQDKEEMKAKLEELQDLVMRLVAERNDLYGRYAGAVGSAASSDPDLLPAGEDRRGHTDDSSELEAMEIIPLSEPTPHQETPATGTRPSTNPEPSPPALPESDGTARQIMQLLQEIRNPPRAAPFMGDNPCVPFFYRPDERDEVKILVV
ncbi:golgin subfamily A member 2 isoform X3 [Stigmatopora argus]